MSKQNAFYYLACTNKKEIKKMDYQMCEKCLHLLTNLHFNNSKICDICTKKGI